MLCPYSWKTFPNSRASLANAYSDHRYGLMGNCCRYHSDTQSIFFPEDIEVVAGQSQIAPKLRIFLYAELKKNNVNVIVRMVYFKFIDLHAIK